MFLDFRSTKVVLENQRKKYLFSERETRIYMSKISERLSFRQDTTINEQWSTLVDVLIARSWPKFSPRMSKVRTTFKQVIKYFSIKHISHRVIHYYALVACAFLDTFVIHIRLCCFQFRLTATKSGPYVVTINIKWVCSDFSTLDWSLVRAETSLSLGENEWK